ncbi:metallophosphoesterase [Pseudooceanicola sp. MF1-13]|uniref:metallophosphoesterase n=1 Tax=Pseudooceanicola sp. MF1-13 TaxID=3379095 RepID=UPI0038919907
MVFKRLKSLFATSPNNPKALSGVATRDTIFAPDTPFCAIGDIHGRLDLLKPLYERLRSTYGTDTPVVFLGDLVDRGPNTAGVLSYVQGLTEGDADHNITIMGNHEQMMLEFIDDPAGNGTRWLRFGGQETLQSFGIAADTTPDDAEDLVDLADEFEQAMPEGMISWMRNLPALWSTGNMYCVHAGMNPEVEPTAQKPRTLINGHPDFLTKARSDRATVVHGHTVMEDAAIWDGRVSLDTGAYYTDKLTAAYIEPGNCTFID